MRAKRRWVRGAYVAAGTVLMVLGALLVVTPVPGGLMLVGGAALVARGSPRVAKLLARLRRRRRRALLARAH